MSRERPFAAQIRQNEAQLRALHDRIHALLPLRGQPEGRKQWEQACQVFHESYDALAFPGGLEQALQQLQAGDTMPVEAALTFLEIQPYFFRSQYIRTKLLRRLKQLPLTAEQAARFQALKRKGTP